MIFPARLTPMVSTSENALKRLISYHIAVWFIVLVALVLQAALGWRYLLFAFVQIVLAVAFSILLIAVKKLVTKQNLMNYLDYMQPLTYALLAALLLPTEAPFYIIVLAIIGIHFFGWFFKKMFKKNIIHPVLLSIFIVQLMFREQLPISETMVNIFQESSLSFGRIRFWFGFYEGLTLGSSAFIILGLLWVYLSVTKIIQFRMSLWFAINLLYIVVVFALFTDYSFWSMFTNLLLGYTILTFVFFIAEPTATPETSEMMVVYPFIAAMFTALFRLQFNIVEASLYAIVFAQFITWVFEQFLQRTSKLRIKAMYAGIFMVWLIILLNFILA